METVYQQKVGCWIASLGVFQVLKGAAAVTPGRQVSPVDNGFGLSSFAISRANTHLVRGHATVDKCPTFQSAKLWG